MRRYFNKRIRRLLSGWLLITFILLANHAHAYKLIPLSVEMTPFGPGARQSFRIENPSDVPIAIELKMFSRSMSPNGQDILVEAEDDFIIYPAQAIVMPGRTQAIRVQWIGKTSLKQELAYRMITEQLPVSFDEEQADGGRIKLLVRFIASVYVVPRNTRADVRVTRVSNIRDNEGNNSIEIILSNHGTAHALLRQARITLVSGESKIELTPTQLPMMTSQNVLAGHHRVFVIPRPKDLASGEISALIKYQGQ
ncbi:MAG: molecular chaperone [Proteobacteria bacterium]|nr:molecular chaperone [Pseudomonadota bacterium]